MRRYVVDASEYNVTTTESHASLDVLERSADDAVLSRESPFWTVPVLVDSSYSERTEQETQTSGGGSQDRPQQVYPGMIGKPEWIEDPELATYAARLKNRERLTRMLDEALMTHDTACWLEHFAGRVPVAPVNDIAQVLENSFVKERTGIRDFEYPDGRTARMVANPFACRGRSCRREPPRRSARIQHRSSKSSTTPRPRSRSSGARR